MKSRPRLTYANVVATIALFCALGGGAYAATALPKNSVGPKQLKKNAVASAKVKDGSLLKKDFKAGQLPAGDRGPEGPAGPAGPRGETGPRGPSDAYVDRTTTQIAIAGGTGTLAASLGLPAGSYVISGKVVAFNNGSQTTADCTLYAGATAIDKSEVELAASAGINLLAVPVQAAVNTLGPTAVQLICTEAEAGGVDVRISERSLIATRVETLTQQ